MTECMILYLFDTFLLQSGKPPLFYAAYGGEVNICKELLDRGANIDAHDDQKL